MPWFLGDSGWGVGAGRASGRALGREHSGAVLAGAQVSGTDSSGDQVGVDGPGGSDEFLVEPASESLIEVVGECLLVGGQGRSCGVVDVTVGLLVTDPSFESEPHGEMTVEVKESASLGGGEEIGESGVRERGGGVEEPGGKVGFCWRL